MKISSTHVEGTPVWWDLASRDVDATKAFYSGLLGWQWNDLMSSPQGVFSQAMLGDKVVGGVYTYQEGMPLPPEPFNWVNAFWVDDAEAAMNRAVEKGGSVIMPACDDPASGGKKSLLKTPEGAPFVVWSGDKGVENEAFWEVGGVCWVEYYTRDVAGLNDFVGHVFGSRYQRVDLMRPPTDFEDAEGNIEYEYHWLKVPGLEPDRGGMMEMDQSWGDMPSHFMTYFRVEDCDASAAKAAELGGSVCVPPTEIPPGKFSVINDPHGATFSIMSLRPMTKIESYKQGTPSWADLSTSDQSAAKDFYSTLFGWEYEDNDAGNGMIYSMAQIGGLPAGAIAPQQPEEAQQGVPPHWNVYITVDDVDAVAERVPELGGNVLMAPMDVFDAGRMIVAQDSVGAVVMFWQPKQHIGAEVRDQHGALTWTLVLTTDKDATATFYSELLDIKVAKDSMPSPDGGTVHQLMVDGQPVAGIMNMPQQLVDMGVPSHWEVYFGVNDAKAACDAAMVNGGQVYMGPADLGPMGTIGYMQDPQGGQFGVREIAGAQFEVRETVDAHPRDRIDALDSERKSNRREPIPRWVKPELFRISGGKCAGCMETSRQIGNFDVDHIIPIADGGTNEFDNLQLLCRSCNSKKGTKTMRELIEILIKDGVRSS